MIGGFALAQIQLGQTNNSYQGSHTTNVTPLPGLTWLYTNISAVDHTVVFTPPCEKLTSACDVTGNPALLCVGSYSASLCAAGDFVEQVSLTTVAGTAFYASGTFPITVALTVYVTGTPVNGPDNGIFGTYTGPTFYLTETAAPVNAENVVLDFDVGLSSTGPGGVTSVSVVVTS